MNPDEPVDASRAVGHPTDEARFVSTGELPAPAAVSRHVADAYDQFRSVRAGTVSTVYPALAEVAPDLFGLCVTGVDGAVYKAGDAHRGFAIMSVAKPFVFAAVAQAIGIEAVCNRVGVDATGLAFNSVEAVERSHAGRTNPMVNAGAIATSSMVPGVDLQQRWAWLSTELSRFTGHNLALEPRMLASALTSNHRNRALGSLLKSVDALVGDPDDAVELYTRQSCLQVTCHDLAMMGATLADGGVHPVTRERVVDAAVARATVTMMAVAGLYETSGRWLLDVGLPGKSGIGGGMVTVAPGKGALGTYAPPLDQAGNSIRGQLTARYLSSRLGLDLFASTTSPPPPPPDPRPAS